MVKAKSKIDDDGQSIQPINDGSADSALGVWNVVSGTSALAGQFVSHLKTWSGANNTPQARPRKSDDMGSVKDQKATQRGSMKSMEALLAEATPLELRNFRRNASLTSLTYYMNKVTPRGLLLRHNMELVTTSLACERFTCQDSLSADYDTEAGDGMGVPINSISRAYNDVVEDSVSAAAPTSNIVAFKRPKPEAAVPSPPPTPWKSTADVVAAKLSEAASVASVASAAVQPIASAAGSLYTGSLSFVSSQMPRMPPLGPPPAAPFIGHVAAPLIATVAAAEVATSPSNTQETKDASTSTPECPSEWFVCDDHSTHTRYFIIQGSDSLDHWKCNLTFEPVEFEDGSLDVRVHKGAYEAAQGLYSRFLPLVQEHLESHRNARVCFVGHSIGGAMACLLLIMMKHRQVLRSDQVMPACTFGAPAFVCDCDACKCEDNHLQEEGHGQCSCNVSVLEKVGLKKTDICNVIMHKDIVPRAFSCDYSSVADLLKSWGPGFKEHTCLARSGKKHLYSFIGTMYILQPCQTVKFTNKEPYHPMLPAKPGLFRMVSPSMGRMKKAVARANDSMKDGHAPLPLAMDAEEALSLLMDNPHPLDILADPGAYLQHGSISRYHNPDNYTLCLGQLYAAWKRGKAQATAEADGDTRHQKFGQWLQQVQVASRVVVEETQAAA